MCLVGFIEVILDLFGSQNLELSVLLTGHTHLNIVRIHFPFKTFTQCQQGRVDGIFQFHIFGVTLFQKVFGVQMISANGGGLPGKLRPGGIDLIQIRASVGFVKTAHEQTDTKGADTTSLCVLLHDIGGSLDQLGNRLDFAIHALVCLGRLSGSSNCRQVDGRRNKQPSKLEVSDDRLQI